MAVLTISHNIFLNSDERHRLVNGESLNTVGISLPVWVHKNKSSEPASEIFCKYIITNSIDENGNIQILKDGYKINLPQKYKSWEPPKLDNEEWRNFTRRQREDWYDDNFSKVISDKGLLDLVEGGSEYLYFREHNKIYKDDDKLEIIHYVTINDMKVIEKSSTISQTKSHSHSD